MVRVGTRLKDATGLNKKKNRSADLEALTERYKSLKTHLKHLITALKQQHGAMVQMNKTRVEVAKNITAMSAHSPIYDCCGVVAGGEESGGLQRGDVCSYASVTLAVVERSKMYTEKYAQFVVDYAVEWEKVVSTRISASLKDAERLRRDLDHYQNKVESLRLTANQAMAKGKMVDPKQAEKLNRNETKYARSRAEYETFASTLCVLLEEVTERAWKDLHPLMIKLVQFDFVLNSDEHKIFATLNQVETQLKQIAQEHGVTPQSRLTDIASLAPDALSTKNQEQEAQNRKRIEYGQAVMSAQSSDRVGGGVGPSLITAVGLDGDEWTQPVAPTSPQEMLKAAQASAPPPTMDAIQNAQLYRSDSIHSTGSNSYAHSFTRSASGSMPKDPYDSDTNSRGSYLSSAGSYMSSSSLPAAPAPAAPPPPPPPASMLSMYSANVNPNAFNQLSIDKQSQQSNGGGYANYNLSSAPMPSSIPTASAPPHPWSGGGNAQPPSTNPFGTSPTYPSAPNTNPFGGSSAPPPQQQPGGAKFNPFDD